MTRRELLTASAAAVAAPGAQTQAGRWNQGSVRHLLPGINHERLLLKASFHQPLNTAPQLRLGARFVAGQRTDTAGQFWQFDAPGLAASANYEVQIVDRKKKPLCDPWPIRTFPAPDARVERFRLMVYTCAGGHDGVIERRDGQPKFILNEYRRKMFQAGLAMQPDAMIAIGDHVYWDQRQGAVASPVPDDDPVRKAVGEFDRALPVLGTANEGVLKRAVDHQIAELYGTMFRSVPTHFVQDDHDYFDNDEGTPALVTFPPDAFMMRAARATQSMYFPEFLPDAHRPSGLAGSSEGDRPPGVSEAYGTLRYGNLVEILLYDCRRYVTLTAHLGGMIPETTEEWLMARMKAPGVAHVVNLPSTPIAWSAGKWGEWYPDLLAPDGKLSTAKPKLFWPEGWRLQHDRLLAAASGMRERIPLFLSGDLHALGVGKILRNGKHDLRHNPVVSVLTGPISTGAWGWPSSARGTPPLVPVGLEVDENLKAVEYNGFTVADFLPDRVELQMFHWKMNQPVANLNNMKPFHRVTLNRPG
jgi:phosphodiesterase/alkaline phosphatase D-like protein